MSKNVIIYTRVSTDEQADRGNSLTNQELVLTQYCKIKGYKIVKHFQEDYSAKTFDRPEWKELIKYVTANKKLIDTILVLRWDRFSRNQKEATNQIDNLAKMGIIVESVEQPLDMSIPENKLLLNIYLTIPEIENTKNSMRTMECSRAARIAGCWTGSAPVGYINYRNSNGRSTLVRSHQADSVIEAFKEVAKNQKPIDLIRKEMGRKGLSLSKQAFFNMLRNVVYTGKIFVKEWKKEEARIVNGLHEAIITDELFRTVQNVLTGRKSKQCSHKEDENFPLRGFLLCPHCHCPLTGGASKGRSRYYNYYKCQKNCIPNIKSEEANNEFIEFLASIKISPEVSDLYQNIMEDVFKQNEGDKKAKLADLLKKVKEVENGFEKANDQFFIKGSINEITFNNSMNYLNKRKADLLYEISTLEDGEDNFQLYTRFALPFLSNLDKHYQNATLYLKKFIVGSIFPEKIYYSEKNYRTTKLNEVLALISRMDKGFQNTEKEKATKNRGLSTWAPPAGVELCLIFN